LTGAALLLRRPARVSKTLDLQRAADKLRLMAKDADDSRAHDAFRERIADLIDINPEALLADGLEGAYIGHTVNQHHAVVAVYDYQDCVNILVTRDGMLPEEADEFLQFNTLGAYVGENGPLFVQRC
jgi:hypothetical protein